MNIKMKRNLGSRLQKCSKAKQVKTSKREVLIQSELKKTKLNYCCAAFLNRETPIVCDI